MQVRYWCCAMFSVCTRVCWHLFVRRCRSHFSATRLQHFFIIVSFEPHAVLSYADGVWCLRLCSEDASGGTHLVPFSEHSTVRRCALKSWSRGRYCTMDEHCSDEPGKGYCWRGMGRTSKLGAFELGHALFPGKQRRVCCACASSPQTADGCRWLLHVFQRPRPRFLFLRCALARESRRCSAGCSCSHCWHCSSSLALMEQSLSTFARYPGRSLWHLLLLGPLGI
jgi:hypothetical protein